MHTLREKTAAAILQWARQNRLRAGDVLPSERELAELTQVSHGTVNRAITRLAAQGRLKREGRKSILLDGQKPAVDSSEEISVLISWQLLMLCPIVEGIGKELGIVPRIEVDQTRDASDLQKKVEEVARPPFEPLLILHYQTAKNLTPDLMRRNPGIVTCSPGIDTPSSIGTDHDALYEKAVKRLVAQGATRIGLVTTAVHEKRDCHWSLFRHWCGIAGVEQCDYTYAYRGDCEISKRNFHQLAARLSEMDGLVIRYEWLRADCPLAPFFLEQIEERRKRGPFYVVALSFDPGVHKGWDVIHTDWEAQIRLALIWLKSRPTTALSAVRVLPRWHFQEKKTPPGVYNLPIVEAWPKQDYLARTFAPPKGTLWNADLRPWLNRLTNRHHSWLGAEALRNFGVGKKCLAGIPFLIAPDEQKRGAACVVFRSIINRHGLKGDLPSRILVGVDKRVKSIYILHACGWVDEIRKLGTYRLMLDNGEVLEKPIWPLGKVHPRDVPQGVTPNIQDWWPGILPLASKETRPVILREGPCPQQARYLYVLRWRLDVAQRVEALEVEVDSDQRTTLALLALTFALDV